MTSQHQWQLSFLGMFAATGLTLGLLWEPGRQQRDEVLAARALLRAHEMGRRELARIQQGLIPLTCGAVHRDCNAALDLTSHGEIQDYTFEIWHEAGKVQIRGIPQRRELPPVRLDLPIKGDNFLP